MMKNHEVDFSVSAILINRARYRCMDFVPVPTWEFRIEALFRHPPVTGYYGQVLLQPFETNVWWTSGVMWIIVIVIIRFVSWVEIKTYDFVATSNEEETVRSWSDTLMIMIGAISEQALKKMRKERFAFHCESLKVFPEIEDTFSDKQKCELTEILIFPPEKCYLAIPWGSPYKEAFSIAMQKAHERGLISYADRTWKFPKPACTIKEEFVSVEMDKIFPAFLIVAMGVFLSFIMLVFEKLIKKR
ncbi:hypothetical protein C0J52_23627 [Blattella germanica]|nr:hypothetical protein C0J52_23627 [Blattella germanica]